MEIGYVYIVSFEDDVLRRLNPYAKIGKAVDLKKRLSVIQIGSPLRLRVFGYIESERSNVAEKYIHKLLTKDNVSGEWFQVSPKLIQIIRSRFSVLEDRLDDLVVSSSETVETIRIRSLEAHIQELNKTIEMQKSIIRQNQETFIRIRDSNLINRKACATCSRL